MSSFQPATRKRLKLRLALDGPSGSGKTYTLLRFAFALGKKVAVIDTEHGSASQYQGDAPDGVPFNFQVRELDTFSPTEYVAAIEEAAREGYDVLIIDSLSHAWIGQDGALELVNKKGGNSFTAWRDVTPMHNRMIEAILAAPMHVLVAMRSKMEYVLEDDEKGKKVPRKIGMAPIQRAGMEYEFTIYGSMDWSHVMTVTKSRCSAVADAIVVKPGAQWLSPVIRWLETGEIVKPKPLPPMFVADDQMTRIIGLIAAGGKDMQKEKAFVFKRYSVDDWSRLTPEQAEEYEKRLAAGNKNKKVTGEVDAAITPVVAGLQSPPATPQDAPPAASVPPSNGQPQTTATAAAPKAELRISGSPQACPHDLLQAIAAERSLLFHELGIPNAADGVQKVRQDDLWSRTLAKRGVTTARDLNQGQAEELLETLKAKVMELATKRMGGETTKSPANNSTFQSGPGDTPSVHGEPLVSSPLSTVK